MDLIAIELVEELTLGDALVGVGTLALAGVTAWLASRASAEVKVAKQGLDLTRESIEAQDRPFLVATPERNGPAIDYIPVGPGGGAPPTDIELNMSVTFENWGKGPAILDGVSVRDASDQELVSDEWRVESGFLVGESRDYGIGLGNASGIPAEDSQLTVRLFYRSAGGARYETAHRMSVGPRQSLFRLDFRRSVIDPGNR